MSHLKPYEITKFEALQNFPVEHAPDPSRAYKRLAVPVEMHTYIHSCKNWRVCQFLYPPLLLTPSGWSMLGTLSSLFPVNVVIVVGV